MLRKNLKLNMSMRLKLIVSFTGVLLVFMTVALFNLYQFTQIKADMKEQNEKVELKVMALELKEMVQEMNIIASGLEISKNSDFISKYNAKRDIYNEMVKKIGDTAVTAEQQKWRSQLIQASVDYINNFDTAASLVQNPTMKELDLNLNLQYLYGQSQELKDHIFSLVDKFYVQYAESADQAVAESAAAMNNTSRVMLAASAAVLILTVIIAFMIIRSFTRPISRLQKAVSLIASGDLRHLVEAGTEDELGRLSDSFDQMILQVRRMLGSTKQIASSLSEHSQSFHSFAQSTASANGDILKAIHEISIGTDEQAIKSEESSQLIHDLDEEIRDITAYTDEMKRTSGEAAVNTHRGTESVHALKASAEQSHKVLSKVDEAMNTLASSSKKVGAIIRSITEISTQTNVLALNAAIEAARAGSHGKGFSVIADEVRQLSQQTNDSSKQISSMIQALQKQIQELQESLQDAREQTISQSKRVGDTLESFEGIERSMQNMTNQIEHIHAKIGQARKKNETLVSSVQFVAAIAQETAAGVEEVNSTSKQQDLSIRRIAEEADDIYKLSQKLFAEISQFQLDAEQAETPPEADKNGELRELGELGITHEDHDNNAEKMPVEIAETEVEVTDAAEMPQTALSDISIEPDSAPEEAIEQPDEEEAASEQPKTEKEKKLVTV